jgi:hypothetical protein
MKNLLFWKVNKNPVHAIGSLTDLGGLHLGANHHGTLAPTPNFSSSGQKVANFQLFTIGSKGGQFPISNASPNLSPKHLTSQSQLFPHDDALDKNTPA